MTATSRRIVRTGIAQYFGGPTFVQDERAYRGAGPLESSGLYTVRAYWPKRVNDNDFTQSAAASAGRGMGASMVVEIPTDLERRQAIPAVTGKRNIVYSVTLHCYHLAYRGHAEDAGADVDDLIEAIKGHVHEDPTLAGTCYQAGENTAGIRTIIAMPSVNKELTETYFRVMFDAEVEINA